MASSSLAEVVNGPFIAAYLSTSLALFALATLAGRLLFEVRAGEAAMQGLAAVLANTGYMGLPLATAVLGKDAAVPIVVGLTIDVALLIPLGIAIVEAGKGVGGGWRHMASSTLGALIRNPLIIAIFAGASISATGLGLPGPIDGFAELLGEAAGPCALFALGATLAGQPLSGGAAEISYMTVFKLFVHPAVLWLATTQLFAVSPFWATAATLGAALPVAANVFIVARQYDVYVARTSSAILVSTAISLLTIPALLAALGAT